VVGAVAGDRDHDIGVDPSEKVTVPLALSSSPARVKAALGAAAR